jgi:surfeit locus 1 family protein
VTPQARAGWLAAALLGIGAFASLGSWQWQRGIEKRARLEQQDTALRRAEPAALAAALQAPDAATVQRVEGRGRYLPPLLLLDNQQRAGKVGLRVYAVAKVDAAPAGVLVDLGWVALPPERVPPPLTLPAGDRPLAGLLAPWPGQGLRLADNRWPEAGAPVLLSYLDRGEIERAAGMPLAPGVLRLAPQLDYGYQRDLDLLPNTLPPERHFGYAVQWFALAATVAAVYLLLSWRARRRSPR